MILKMLLSFASISWGQNPSIPLPDFKSPQAQQAVQNSLNSKFSVFGGTVTGNVVLTSSITLIGPLVFPDTTIQTTAFLGSTFTICSADLTGTTNNATTFGVAVATITFVATGPPYWIVVQTQGSTHTTGAAGQAGMGFLLDGKFPPLLDANTGICGFNEPGSSNPESPHCVWKFQPAAGSHTFALTNVNTSNIFTYGVSAGTGRAPFKFCVSQIP